MKAGRILKNIKKHKVGYTCAAIFVISFLYIMFFTNHIPFFWDEIIFHENYFKQSLPELAHEFFSIGSDSISSAPRTVYALFFKSIFHLAGYNIVVFRTIKAVIFAFFIMSLFYFSNRHIRDYISSLLFSFFVMFSFSLYIHTLVYAEPYLYSEIFKIIAFYIFLKDFNQKKTSIARQISIGFFGFLALRTYQPAYSIPLILSLYILFSRFKHLKRYFVLMAFLFAANFPFKSIISFDFIGGGTYQPNIYVIKKFLFNDLLAHIVSPAIYPQNLYYKPIIAVITFFGFWLFMFALAVYLFRKRLAKTSFISSKKILSFSEKKSSIFYSHKSIIIFLCAWMIAELPLWIILPEHAIRYANEILVPFMMLYFILVSKSLSLFRDNYRKIALVLAIVFISLACLTNIAYTTVFRAGWGSSFVGFEKVTDYIEGQREEDSLVLYYSQGVADEYYPMNISKPTRDSRGHYEIVREGVEYRMVGSVECFSKGYLKDMSGNYSEVYVIKRVTSFLKNELPPVDFDSYENLTLLAAIKGDTSSLFDKTMSLAAGRGLDYEPQKFYIYRYRTDTIKRQ